MPKESPVRPYRTIVQDSNDPGYINRLLIGTAATGLVRIEWVQGRYGQIIPINWSMVQVMEFFDSYIPLRYQVADAQNLIVRQAVLYDFEWLLLIEHDTIPPSDGFIRINQYMLKEEVPVVSGLYYSRSRPSEPLIFRGRGVGAFYDWKQGDLVWCDGVPTGFLLIHCGILREMWKESPEYMVKGQVTRRVFDSPVIMWDDPAGKNYNTLSGTSDLQWCTRVMKEGFFKKAGWDKYQDMQHPFLVDTNIFCKHIDQDGVQYP